MSGDGLIVCLPARPLFCPLPIFAEAMEGAVRWFQLYPPKDHKLTDSFLQRAEAAGYSAIVVTIDSTLLGWRERDLRNTTFRSYPDMGWEIISRTLSFSPH